jgi:phage host-nuclease inhibitor protein Gam
MDEIAGYLPPVANPASKAPMLTLLKQARAFGVGMVLATQNPMDLDYKALSNAGTWIIGRLQTDRDQARVLDGLEGAANTTGGTFDRNAMSALIGGLGKRQFLLHNVHEDHPEVFESRWAMSYLRGPLTRVQIKQVMAGRASPAGQTAQSGQAGQTGPAGQASQPAQRGPTATARSAAWVVPPGVDQYFAPGKAGATYSPMVLGVADVRFTDPKSGVDVTRKAAAVTAITSDPIPVDWDNAVDAGFDVDQLSKDQPPQAAFADLPAASKAKNYDDWSKTFVTWVSTSQQVTIYRSAASGLASNGLESEGDFRARLQHASREKRDQKIADLRQQYAPKVASLEDRLRRAQQAVEKEKSQATGQWIQAGISIAGSVLGMLTSRKTVSVTNLGRVTTAARGMGRGMQQYEDVGRAKDTVEGVQQQIDATNTELQSKVDAIDTNYDPQTEKLDTVAVKPKRTGINVQLLALAWVPRP